MKENQLQIVALEQAKKLKRAGFDWKVSCMYDANGDINFCKRDCYSYQTVYANSFEINFNTNDKGNATPDEFGCSAPTVALALKWFRDLKRIVNHLDTTSEDKWAGIYSDGLYWERTTAFDTYEESESALLDELLKRIE